jgi:tellurite resistance protein
MDPTLFLNMWVVSESTHGAVASEEDTDFGIRALVARLCQGVEVASVAVNVAVLVAADGGWR